MNCVNCHNCRFQRSYIDLKQPSLKPLVVDSGGNNRSRIRDKCPLYHFWMILSNHRAHFEFYLIALDLPISRSHDSVNRL